MYRRDKSKEIILKIAIDRMEGRTGANSPSHAAKGEGHPQQAPISGNLVHLVVCLFGQFKQIAVGCFVPGKGEFGIRFR